jgi:Tfp pilus assembly protein PilF
MGQKVFILLLLVVLWLSACSAGPQKSANLEFGVEMAERGLWKEATYRWQQVLQTDPGNAAAHNNLAVAYEEAGQYDLAVTHYKKALELSPQNEMIRDNYRDFQEFYNWYTAEEEKEEENEETDTEKQE